MRTLSVAATLTLAAVPVLPAQDRAVLIEAARVILAPGETLDGKDARLLVRDGKVAAVGAAIQAEAAERARRVSLPDATIAPGLVLVHDLLGRAADLGETIEPFTPHLLAADAFDPFDDVLPDRARTGVTTVGFAPASTNPGCGTACVVKWNGELGVVAAPQSYVKFALVPEALGDDRYPTSRMGASELLRASFAAASSPLGALGPAEASLRAVADGARPAAIHARTHAEVSAALDLAEELGIQPLLIGCTEIEEATIERLRGGRVTLALDALDTDSTAERLATPARLAQAGVPFSFVAQDGQALRRAAALAVRNGLDRATALASVTLVPAAQAGVGERVGALRVGRDADFLVLSGDPIDLSSRLTQVWVEGRAVYDAAEAAEASR